VEQSGEATAVAEETKEFLSIGEFSRRSWLSPKALRLYERLDLLPPAHVDEDNGYRRYREEQLETARLIAMLRRLDMPLTEVAKVVATPSPDAAELVRSYWDETERRIASQRELAKHLRIRLSGEEGSYEMYDVRERNVPEQTVLTEQRHVLVPELQGWIEAAGTRLIKAAAKRGGAAGPMFVIYHGAVNEDSDGPVEVCIPVAAEQAESKDVAMRREPAHHEAYVRITKAQVGFPQILSAYDAVTDWIRTHGLTVEDCAPREIYFADWDAAGPDDEVCDIAYPVPEP
jgi:DNA-binding transcriptional MerR regulator